MAKPIINIDDVKGLPFGPKDGSETFGAKMFAPVAQALGLGDLGISVTVVEPGKRAFPYHNHLAVDEAFVILSGQGVYRFGGQEYPVRPGDICAAPRGGQDRAHQLINTGTEELKYLGLSTRSDPDVVEYPDSAKFAVTAIAPGKNWLSAHLRQVHRREDGLDYWDGEET